MSRLGPLYAALAIFPLIAAGALLPYVALRYRRQGSVGIGHLALAGVFALYLVGLALVVILPLRPVTPDFCTLYGVDPEVNPLSILNEVRQQRAESGLRSVIYNPDLQGTILNVFLFVPMGLFVRHFLRRGFWLPVAIGFAASLAIELTQLTGNWGIYPCAYRFFATLDLATNTLGTAIGTIFAPLLVLVPGQESPATANEPRAVRWQRRLLAAVCNAAAIAFTGLVLLALSGLVLEVTRGQLLESDSARAHLLRAFALVVVPGLLVLLAVPLASRGRTPGEWAVLVEPATLGAGAAAVSRDLIVLRFVTGHLPLLILAAVAVAGAAVAWIALVLALAIHLVLLLQAKRFGPGVELRVGARLIDSR